MIRHLTAVDYKAMPWANGKGTTVEMLRVERGGVLALRLSRAQVVEDGDFSIFPGVERNLTVLTGPGFDLVGAGLHLHARPLVPLAFSGDVALRAEGVTGPSDDFNVMTARDLGVPWVRVVASGAFAAGGTLAVFALDAARVGGVDLARYDLVVTDQAVAVAGAAIVVRVQM